MTLAQSFATCEASDSTYVAPSVADKETTPFLLGDFGSSQWSNQIQGQLGRHRIGPYAETFAAPEMDFDDSWLPGQHVVQFLDHWDPNLPPTAPGGRPGGYVQRPAVLSSRTNMWQVGMLMLSAIRLEPHLLETQWRDPPDPANYPIPMHQAMGFRPGFASQPMKMRLDDAKSKQTTTDTGQEVLGVRSRRQNITATTASGGTNQDGWERWLDDDSKR
ncbi:hypothetical protein KCU83_g2499, partial [Aureobasidium melanogenum]